MSGVRVRVPATTANLGPGFDCLGCALTMYASFTCETIPSGLEITGCPEPFRNADNLFVRAFRRAEQAIGAAETAFRLHIATDVPVSRGLGSSATLLAGGVAAANALHGSPLSRQAMVELCNELEGHPDNVAPAVLGGMCASLVRDGRPVTARVDVSSEVGFIALIPNYASETRAMRAALPKEVPFADAVFNASHLAVLLRAFEAGDFSQIAAAMDDRLHQPYRLKLIPGAEQVFDFFDKQQAYAAYISGAGSTLMGLVPADRMKDICQAARAFLDAQGLCGWQVLGLRAGEGARIVTAEEGR